MAPDTLIRVHRNEKDVGYFTRETARECLRNGVLRFDDWAYCEGLNDWVLLSQLIDVNDTIITQHPALLPPPLPVAKPPPLPSQRPPILPEKRRVAHKSKLVPTLVVIGAIGCFVLMSLVISVLPGSRSGVQTPYPSYPDSLPGSTGGSDGGRSPAAIERELRDRIVDYDRMQPLTPVEKEMVDIILNGPLFEGRKVTEREFVETLDRVLKSYEK